MRQMTKKRKNSPESDGESSDENGVASNARASDSGSDDSASEKSDKNTKTRRSSIKKRSSRSRGKQEDPVDETPENEEQEKPAGSEQENGQKGSSKRRKKEEKPAATAPSQNEENEDDDEYEVEKVVAQRTIKGRRQFLVRWKGYGEDADTWEQEKDLNCQQLIEEFLAEQADEESTEKTPKSTKSKSPKKTSKKAKKVEGTKNDEQNDNEEDEDKEFEVERIIDVHFLKNKKRLFLIRWKGFSQSDDSWEPEENLNCPDLIAKFMEKLESAKKVDRRELRINPALTKPCTLGTHGRRHSRRNVDKQRVTYQGCE